GLGEAVRRLPRRQGRLDRGEGRRRSAGRVRDAGRVVAGVAGVVGGPPGGDPAQPVDGRRRGGQGRRGREGGRVGPAGSAGVAGGGGAGGRRPVRPRLQAGPGRGEQPAVGLGEAGGGDRVAAGDGRQGPVGEVAGAADDLVDLLAAQRVAPQLRGDEPGL